MQRAAFILIGAIFIIYDVVLRLFIVVCAIFAIYVMMGLIIEWTSNMFRKPAAKSQAA